ncbi:MAG: phage major capsid protein, partial [Eubacterium sp.]|nr:phage major capsid protein [Eubacterium sp.]
MENYKITDLRSPEYDKTFWNSLRGNRELEALLNVGRDTETGTFELPPTDLTKFSKELSKKSLPRQIASVIPAYGTDYTIYQKDTEDLGTWVAPGETIPIYDGANDFTKNPVGSFKLVSFVKFDEDFVRDATFPFNDYLIGRFAKVVGRTEEQAFIAGTGAKMPTGITHPEKGAEVAVTSKALSYDDVLTLFFSLDPEYRANARFIMNDKTALKLRTLKDGNGNYLWRSTDDTILGKPVTISNFMPDAEAGNIPVVFGDMSYYWLICR